MKRKYDIIMMKTAIIWSELSYCKRLKVGAVLSKDGRIIACGYNGTISGEKNICEEIIEKCPYCLKEDKKIIENNKCKFCNKKLNKNDLIIIEKTNEFTLHAEQNVISFCAKNGISTQNTSLYVTHSPCKNCAKLIAQSGIKNVFYLNEYRDTSGIDFLKKLKINVQKLNIN